MPVQLMKSLIFTTILCITQAAWADTQRVLVVSVPSNQASRRGAQYLSYGFRDSVRRDSHFQLAPLGPLYGERPVDGQRVQKEADRIAAEGQLAADNLETEKAQQKFSQAMQKLQDNLAELESTKPAARIALLAAGAALLGNDDKQGRRLIELALLYDPNCAPDPRSYNASMMAVFRDVRGKLSRASKGALAVSSNPAYAELYVDGDFIGLTPDKIDRLGGGPHLVRLVRDGYRTVSQVVDVHGGRVDAPVTINLTPAADADKLEPLLAKAAGDVGSRSSTTAAGFALKAQVPLVLVCAVSVNGEQTKVEAALFRQDGKRVAFSEHTFSADGYRDEADHLWRSLSNQAAGGPPGVGAIDEGERVGGTTRLKPIVSWGLIGAGVASAGVGVVFGVLALGSQNNLQKLAQTSDAVPAAQNTVKTQALVADVLYGLGGGLAVAGVLCLIFWDDKGARRDVVGLGPVDVRFGLGSVQVGGEF
jgi:hypothetical protein